MAGAAPGTTFGVDLGFATSALTWALLRQPSPVTCPFLAFRNFSVCQAGNLFAGPETLLGSFGHISGHSLALQSPVTCPLLAFRNCRLAGRQPLCSSETLLGSFGHISGRSLAFQSPVTCPFLAFRDCRLPGRKPHLQARKRFSAALATFLDTALPCKAPSHVLS